GGGRRAERGLIRRHELGRSRQTGERGARVSSAAGIGGGAAGLIGPSLGETDTDPPGSGMRGLGHNGAPFKLVGKCRPVVTSGGSGRSSNMATNRATVQERFAFAFGFVFLFASNSVNRAIQAASVVLSCDACAAFSPSTVITVPSLHSTRTPATGTPASLALLMARMTSLRLKRFSLRRPIALTPREATGAPVLWARAL